MRSSNVGGVLVTRLLGALLVVWLTVTVAFFAVKLIPGDPVDVMLGPLATVSEASKEQIRADLGLNQSVFVQYVHYLAQLVTGNLGTSFQLNESVTLVLGRALGPTAALASLATLFACVFVAMGVLIARTRVFRATVATLQIAATTLPIFWVSYLLLFVFAFGLGWFPATSGRGFLALILPAVALAIPVAGLLGQVLHSGMADTETRPFWLSVRSRGVSQFGFDTQHAVRHGLGSVVPLTTQIVGGLLGGAVLVEQVFSRPGLGSVALTAIINRDMPVILGVVAFSAVVFAVLTILADALVWLIDPRTRVSIPARMRVDVHE